MTTKAAPKGADARERILVAAERLIAEHGIDVPLRDIAIAADQRNNSAVQYHFGSRDGLIAAVIDHRSPPVEERRVDRLARLEAEGAADDARSLVATLVEPMLQAPELDGATHYARFLEQVRTHPSLSDPSSLRHEGRASVRLVMARLRRLLAPLPTEIRACRLRSLATVMFALLADHERAVEAGELADPRKRRVAEQQIVDMLTAMLTTTAS